MAKDFYLTDGKLTVKQLSYLIAELLGETASGLPSGMTGYYKELGEKVKDRTQHYFREPKAAPPLPAGEKEGWQHQTTKIQQAMGMATARCTENHWVADSIVDIYASASERAGDLWDVVLNEGAADIELAHNSGSYFQAGLTDGKWRLVYSVLTWDVDESKIPEYGEDEEVDKLPRDAKQRGRYGKKKNDSGKHTETWWAHEERYRYAKAKLGLPFRVEFVNPGSYGWKPAKYNSDDIGTDVILRRVRLFDLNGELAGEGRRVSLDSMSTEGKRLSIAESLPLPLDDTTDMNTWGTEILLAKVRTDTECYELIKASTGGDWELLKSYKHGWGRVPAAIAFAYVWESELRPEYRYQPFLLTAYGEKVEYDRILQLFMRMAENAAMKRRWGEREPLTQLADPNAQPKDKIDLSVGDQNIPILEPGVHLKETTEGVSPEFMRMVETVATIFQAALPPSGDPDIGRTTAPWTARQALIAASVLIKMSIQSDSWALKTMFDSWVNYIRTPAEEGGLGTGVYIYSSGKHKEDKERKGKLIGVEPEDLKGIRGVNVSIGDVSALERLTIAQMIMEEMTKLGVGDEERYWMEGQGMSNATEMITRGRRYRSYKQYAEGPVAQMIYQVLLGGLFMMGSDGQLTGAGGQAVPAQAAKEGILASRNLRDGGEAGNPLGGMRQMAGMSPLQAPGGGLPLPPPVA